jgi:hypothetical protein
MYSDKDFLTTPFNDFTRTLFDGIDNECIMEMEWSVDQIRGFWVFDWD